MKLNVKADCDADAVEQIGGHLAKGAIYQAAKMALIGMLFIFACNLVRDLCGWNLDDTDRDAWHRSNMTVLTDAKTGVQYLSDGKGGLTPRLAKPQ